MDFSPYYDPHYSVIIALNRILEPLGFKVVSCDVAVVYNVIYFYVREQGSPSTEAVMLELEGFFSIDVIADKILKGINRSDPEELEFESLMNHLHGY